LGDVCGKLSKKWRGLPVASRTRVVEFVTAFVEQYKRKAL
jgi:hypothetical protein